MIVYDTDIYKFLLEEKYLFFIHSYTINFERCAIMNKKNLASILPFVIFNFYELHLGERIKMIRKFLEISQKELVKHLNVTRKTIIEYKKTKIYWL